MKEILQDANSVQEMILQNDYNKEKIIEIEDKYSVETNFLVKFDDSIKFGFEKNYDDAGLQVLINLRDRLYLIAVYKVLKEEKREIPQDFVKRSYPGLIDLIRKE